MIFLRTQHQVLRQVMLKLIQMIVELLDFFPWKVKILVRLLKEFCQIQLLKNNLNFRWNWH